MQLPGLGGASTATPLVFDENTALRCALKTNDSSNGVAEIPAKLLRFARHMNAKSGWTTPIACSVVVVILGVMAGCLPKFPVLTARTSVDTSLVSEDVANRSHSEGRVRFEEAGRIGADPVWLSKQPDGDWIATGHWSGSSRSFVFNWADPQNFVQLVPVPGFGGWRVVQRRDGIDAELRSFVATTAADADRVVVVTNGSMTVGFGKDRATFTVPEAPPDARFGLTGPKLSDGDALELFTVSG